MSITTDGVGNKQQVQGAQRSSAPDGTPTTTVGVGDEVKVGGSLGALFGPRARIIDVSAAGHIELQWQNGKRVTVPASNVDLEGRKLRIPGGKLPVPGAETKALAEREPKVAFTSTPAPRQVRGPDGTMIPTAKATATPEGLSVAGTLAAKEFTIAARARAKAESKATGKEVEAVVAEGPHAFDPRIRQEPRNLYSRIMSTSAIRYFWGRGDKRDLPRFTGADIEKLTYPGPNGEPPVLQPGDFILNGGDGSIGHLVTYVGKNADGVPEIVHAMATQYEGRSALQRIGDVLLLPFVNYDKTGVIRERLGGPTRETKGFWTRLWDGLRGKPESDPTTGFFGRYFRDSVVIVRVNGLTPKMVARGIADIKTHVGKGYDFSFSQTNGDFYCSEVGVHSMIKKAFEGSGKRLPWVGSTYFDEARGLSGQIGVKGWLVTPENVAVSPDVEVVFSNKTGGEAYAKAIRTIISGKKVAKDS